MMLLGSGTMTALQNFLTALGAGIDVVAGCEGMSEADLIAAGAPDKTAAQLVRLHSSFFGSTAMTRMQRDAVKAARQRRHSLPTLEVIDHYARKAKTLALGWQMRLELCRTSADTLAMEALAKKKLKEHRTAPKPQEGVKIFRRRNAPWTMAITAPSHVIAALNDAVDDKRPIESIQQAFFKGAPARRGLQTNILVPLDALTRILDGDGEEVTLRMTNGATMTGADYVNKVISGEIDLDDTLATLFHPVQGPVNLYREERMASLKQRIMAMAESPVCAWDDCNRPADECQVHHIIAWKHGGFTNPENLVMLCPYHNGINQDDPNAPPGRGRMARVAGTVRRVFGSAPPPTDRQALSRATGPPQQRGDPPAAGEP